MLLEKQNKVKRRRDKINLKRQTKGYLMVAVAGILWGTIGLQVKTLLNY